MRGWKTVCLIVLCLVMLAGCRQKKPTEPGESQQTDDPKKEMTELVLAENGISDFEIIYPSEGTATGIYAANYLQQAFQDRTGIRLPVKDDHLKAGDSHENSTYKILVGQTNYRESADAMKNLRYYDYGVLAEGENLLIVGWNADDLCMAIDWLAETVLGTYQADRPLIFREEYRYEYEYPCQSVKLGDVELKEFEFVYTEGKDLEYVEKLRNALAHSYGYVLPLVHARDAKDAPHRISFLNTESPEAKKRVEPLHYQLKASNGSIDVQTGGLCSMKYVTEQFMTFFEDLGNGSFRMEDNLTYCRNLLDDPNNTGNWSEGTDLRIMDMNILAQDYAVDFVDQNGETVHFESADFRREIIHANLNYYQPAIVGIQEMDERMMEALKAHPDYGTKYELLTGTDPKSTLKSRQYYNGILYRKDLLTLEEGSFDIEVYQTYAGKAGHRCRNMAYATFEIQKTGSKFIFFVTHWDVSSREPQAVTEQSKEAVSKVNQLIAERNLPVFCMADWNSNEVSPYIKNFMKGTGVVNTRYTTKNLVNSVGSFHEYGRTDHSGLSCDIIFSSPSVECLMHETLFYNQQIWASDHSWILVDVKLK